jgi:myosin heavy subunit
MFKNSLVVFQCEFIGKNNDALHSDLEAVLHTSQDNFLKSLFPNKQEADNFLLPTKKKLAFDSIGSKFKVKFFFFMYYLKHEQQCFVRYKDTRRSRVSLGLIKHALRMF